LKGRGAGAALALVLALAALFCLTSLAEVDYHWHLLTGERILREWRVPRVDDLSYTSEGRPWVDSQWLFEVLLAVTRRAGGDPGLDLLKVACVVGAFLLAASAARRRATAGVTAILALLAVVASQERFAARPEIASFLMLAAVLRLLEERRESPGRLVLLPPLFTLWANLHALYAVGLGALGLAAAGDTMERLGEPPDPGGPRPGRVWLCLGVSAAATLLSPYGLRGWSLPLRLLFGRVLSGGVFARTIAEFQPPFGGGGATAAVIAFALLAAVVTGAAAIARREARPADSILVAVFLVLALLARRNLPLFSLVALAQGAPLLSAATRLGREAVARRSGRGARALAAGGKALVGVAVLVTFVMMGGVVTNRFYARDAIHRRFGRGEAPCAYPDAAAGFIDRAGPRGRVLNDMAIGGYLAWRWYPERPVFIDGRLEVHDETLYAAYLGLLSDPRRFEETARRYGIDAVLWSHRESGEAAPLLRHLAGGHGWHPVFADGAAVVFARDGAAGSPPAIDLGDPVLAGRILDQIAAARVAEEDPLPRLLRRLLPRVEPPVPESDAALTLAACGAWAAAERLYREALIRAPRNATLHYDLALVLEGERRVGEARRELQEALALDGSLAPARQVLAHLRLGDGDPEAALEEWRLAARAGPLAAEALLERGDLLARRGRIEEATADYLEAIRREPAWEAPRIALARVRAAAGDAAGAERILRQILAGNPASPETHHALAAILAAAGRLDEAAQEARAAASAGLDPAILRGDPALRPLENRPELRDLLDPGRRR
jgi:Tfp pilus assembly protein PilF